VGPIATDQATQRYAGLRNVVNSG